MAAVIFLCGIVIGFLLSVVINTISYNISTGKNINNLYLLKDLVYFKAPAINYWVILISGLLFLISFLITGISMMFVKAAVLGSILIIVSFIDLMHHIIPDKIVVITLVAGALFSFVGDISFTNSVMGMLAGGGILFLLALIPGAIGGGDIKLMFALGSFLGFYKTLWSLCFAFILASAVSAVLLLLRIKGRKDHIPFGPFLALGCFASFLIFT